MSRSASNSGSRLAALAWLGLAACSIPDTAFHATPDAGGGTDAMSSVLAIKPSMPSFDVDEGSTKDFSVTLSQAPSAELIVTVQPGDAASAAAIGISVPQLRFEPTNFDQPQSITVTGLVDADVADALANITLSADGVDPVTVAATVRDHDKLEIATDIGASGILTVNETKTADVHVHLTHQPAADVRVQVMLGAGPVTVAPAECTFTAANYNVDQTFTFTAPDDVNVVSEDEALTFQAVGLPDKLYTIHDVDKDTLNINATPTTMSVNEGGSAQISVTLTKQPSANTTVHLALQSGNVSINHTDLTFTPQNFDQAQVVTVSAPEDQNTVNEQDQITLSILGSTVQSVTVSVTTIDNDVQAILEDAPDPLSVSESQTATFGVTLKFQPTTNVIVQVASLDINVATASPGTLTFTPQNYNDASVHQVTVTGAHDNNLATDTTKIKLHEATMTDVLVPVSVVDVDTQKIVLSKTSLSVQEGQSATFNVSLGFDPGATVMVSVTSTNSTSVPVSPSSITFTGGPSGNWATPVSVTVSPPVDTNNVGETATVTVSGGGAPQPATVAVTVIDPTVVKQYGWPAPPPFTGSTLFGAGSVVAYQITVDAVAGLNLDAFGLYVPAGSGFYRMALYRDAGNVPGALVAQIAAPIALGNGVNVFDLSPDAPIDTTVGTKFWIALRISQNTAVTQSTTSTGLQCFRSQDIPNINDPWPSVFGTPGCQTVPLTNFWINTFHQ